MDKLFREHSRKIHIILGKESIDDPDEKNTTISFLNPIPIKAIVSDIVAEKLIWKFPGIKVEQAKELILRKRDLDLIRLSHKILIDGIEFYAYQDNIANFSIEHLRCDWYRVNVWRVK